MNVGFIGLNMLLSAYLRINPATISQQAPLQDNTHKFEPLHSPTSTLPGELNMEILHLIEILIQNLCITLYDAVSEPLESEILLKYNVFNLNGCGGSN